MVANHIHHALAQVRELQQKILDKQRFKGYSGRARAISGTLALAAAAVMSTPFYPQHVVAHLAGWTAVLISATILNFGAVVYWYLLDPISRREVRRLRPALDVLPPIGVGAVMTLALVSRGHYEYLFGVWICLFGLANLAARHAVPPRIWIPATFYLLSGTIYLLWPNPSFLNPWPMGLVFFLGEWACGLVLHFDGTEDRTLSSFLSYLFNGKEEKHVHEV
ncbi:MAG TPA: hypothetical protein VLR94_06945 [Acidobacteriota bacterium]|nr:hypothetical protein [Acidobacteriota bacterium]